MKRLEVLKPVDFHLPFFTTIMKDNDYDELYGQIAWRRVLSLFQFDTAHLPSTPFVTKWSEHKR